MVDNKDKKLSRLQITKSRDVTIVVLLPQEARHRIGSLYNFETSKNTKLGASSYKKLSMVPLQTLSPKSASSKPYSNSLQVS